MPAHWSGTINVLVEKRLIPRRYFHREYKASVPPQLGEKKKNPSLIDSAKSWVGPIRELCARKITAR